MCVFHSEVYKMILGAQPRPGAPPAPPSTNANAPNKLTRSTDFSIAAIMSKAKRDRERQQQNCKYLKPKFWPKIWLYIKLSIYFGV